MSKIYFNVKEQFLTGYRIRILGLFGVLLLFYSPVFAYQGGELLIEGTVTDQNEMPLPGVTVIESGTDNGTQTDFDGNYSIEVASEESVLVFSFVGMQNVERTANEEIVDVVMKESQEALDEVVVVGYGTQSDLRLLLP